MKAKVGLALGGGGARGLAHIGVLKVFEREKIPLSCIAGSSIGAIIGGLYAFMQSAGAVEDFVNHSIKQPLFDDIYERSSHLFDDLNHERREHFFTYLKTRLSLLKVINHNAFLDAETVDEIFKSLTDTPIEDLPVRFSAIATDLLSGQEIVIDKGSLKKAIMASSAIPAIFPPVRIDGHLLVDGSTSDSVPVHVLKDRGADRIIAVNVSKCVRKIGPISNALHILYRSDEIATYHLTQERLAGADLVIRPNVGRILWYDFRNVKEIVALGETAAEKALPEIEKLLKMDISEIVGRRLFHKKISFD